MWSVVRVVLALGIFSFVVTRADPGAALAHLRAAPWWALVVPSVLLLANSCLHAVRLRLLLPAPRPSWWAVLRCVLLGNFIGLALPTGGGEAAKVVALSRHTGSMTSALGPLGASRVMELGPWGLLVWWGAVAVLPGHVPAFVPFAWLSGAAMLGVLLVAGAAMRWPGPALAWLPAPISRRLFRLAEVHANARDIAACALLAVPFALVNCGVIYVILRAYGVPLTYLEVMGVIPTIDIIISLPITVSGLGVREGMFVVALAGWGVDPAVAVAVSFTRWTAELFRSGLGGLWWARSGFPQARVADTSRDGAPTGD